MTTTDAPDLGEIEGLIEAFSCASEAFADESYGCNRDYVNTTRVTLLTAYQALAAENAELRQRAVPAAKLAELRALSERATAGPWRESAGTDFRSDAIKAPLGMTNPTGDGNGLNDRALIVASVNLVFDILARTGEPRC